MSSQRQHLPLSKLRSRSQQQAARRQQPRPLQHKSRPQLPLQPQLSQQVATDPVQPTREISRSNASNSKRSNKSKSKSKSGSSKSASSKAASTKPRRQENDRTRKREPRKVLQLRRERMRQPGLSWQKNRPQQRRPQRTTRPATMTRRATTKRRRPQTTVTMSKTAATGNQP